MWTWILRSTGRGTFQAPLRLAVPAFAVSVAVGDFNGDAKPDLAVISSGSISYDPGSVSVFLGNGDGTFQAPEGFGTNSRRAGAVAVGDFNGDGKLDLAVTTPAGVSVLIQTYSFSGFF